MNQNYCVIDEYTDIVVNIVVWDGVTPWEPPAGTFAVQSDTAGIGWIYDPDDGSLTPPAGE